ncbi:MAG: MFS transporter [Legionellales bacterium RIFCSPHIGHO2_12_FULL_35_11]|nr:MAG: MFS transporter [Legionellales bacterium RIFCSPHIGHO2_12_FULL_35_11]
MYEMNLSALTAAMLSSSFYIIYTGLQIPVGILCDKNNPKILLTTTALICGFGCLIFASSHTLISLFIGRFLIGIGSAFAFVSLAHLVRRHYPINNFSMLLGTSETLGFLATVIGVIGMGKFITHWGWRTFLNLASVLAIIISYLCWVTIPSETNQKPISTKKHLSGLLEIVKNKFLWLNGMYLGLMFAIITVFGALWAVPFLQIKLNCNISKVSIINALLFLGAAIGCPVFGVLSGLLAKRKPLIISSCLISSLILLAIIYLPTSNQYLIGFLMFMLGFMCCSYMLAYAISNELSPANSLSTCTGFTNTLALITVPFLQPFVGYILETVSPDKIYSLSEYQLALINLPICLVIAGILASFLPERS